MITSAEGGAALTNDIKIYDRLKKFSSHGINKKKTNMEFKSKLAEVRREHIPKEQQETLSLSLLLFQERRERD